MTGEQPDKQSRPKFWNVPRVVVFVIAALLAVQVLPWRATAKLVPALSPLLGLSAAAASLSVSALTLLALPLLILALVKGRWFCWHLCPTGFITQNIGKLNPKARSRCAKVPRLGQWFALICIAGGMVGYPVFIWLDPLSLFNSFFSAWHKPFAVATALPAVLFVAILLLNIACPNVWCMRLCPLGAAHDLLAIAKSRIRRRKGSAEAPDASGVGRRTFLGVLAGGAAAFVARRVLGREPTLPIRPPGSVPEATLTGLCARCGNCVRSCPYNIIQPDLGRSGMAGLLTPVLDLSEMYCVEWCNECTKVCPTGAIRKLTMEEKRETAIGLSEVDRTKCLAWRDGAFCMVCQEFCPYLAIKIVVNNGVNCPEVDPEMCRGCGTCHNQCPALPDKAINVHGIRQKRVKPLPTFE